MDLAAHGVFGDFVLLRLPVLAKLPGVAAGPAWHYENSETVGFFVELLAIEAPLESNRIQTHVMDITQISIEPLRGPTQENVRCPSGAANQEIPAINFEETVPLRCEFGSDVANAKGSFGGVRNLPAGLERNACGVQIGIAHREGPPKMWVGKLELRELFGRQSDRFTLADVQCNRLRDLRASYIGAKGSCHGMI